MSLTLVGAGGAGVIRVGPELTISRKVGDVGPGECPAVAVVTDPLGQTSVHRTAFGVKELLEVDQIYTLRANGSRI